MFNSFSTKEPSISDEAVEHRPQSVDLPRKALQSQINIKYTLFFFFVICCCFVCLLLSIFCSFCISKDIQKKKYTDTHPCTFLWDDNHIKSDYCTSTATEGVLVVFSSNDRSFIAFSDGTLSSVFDKVSSSDEWTFSAKLFQCILMWCSFFGLPSVIYFWRGTTIRRGESKQWNN